MALSNQDTFDLTADDGFRNRIAVCCWEACKTILTEGSAAPNHAERMAWAQRVLNNEDGEIRKVVRAVLILLKTDGTPPADTAAVLALTDTELQTKVDACVNPLAGAD